MERTALFSILAIFSPIYLPVYQRTSFLSFFSKKSLSCLTNSPSPFILFVFVIHKAIFCALTTLCNESVIEGSKTQALIKRHSVINMKKLAQASQPTLILTFSHESDLTVWMEGLISVHLQVGFL